MGATHMATLHETDVDGVRCFWVDSGRPTLNASLVFRAGITDETFSTHGQLHLLEHLALHGRGGGPLQVNGSVAPLVTSFDAHGPGELVAEHLSAVARWLREPEFAALTHETKVLQAEGSGRVPTAVGDALLWRYGARGVGLVGAPEFGLSTATPERLRRLATTAFTRSSAVLAFDGPPPAGLSLTLPEGSGRRPAPVAEACRAPYPAIYEAPALVLTGTTPRSTAATLLPEVLESMLRNRLRHADAASYAPWSHYEPVDDHTALVLAGADITSEGVSGVATVAAEILRSIAEIGPPPEVLDEVVIRLAQAMSDPYSGPAFAWRSAHRWLAGHERQTVEDVVAEVRATTVQEVAEAATSVRSSMLIGSPAEAERPWGFNALERPSHAHRTGRVFRSHNWPADLSLLTIGPEQVRVSSGAQAVSVQLAEAVGLVQHAHGERMVVTADGWNLGVDPRVWRNGDVAVSLLDQNVPAELHVTAPADQNVEVPRRLPASRRWWGGLRQAARSLLALKIYLVVLVIGGAIALATRSPIGVVGCLSAGTVAAWELHERSDPRSRAPR